MRTWIAVTDSAHARIFRMRRAKTWALVEEMQHPESRLRAAEVVSDGPGKGRHRTGDGGGFALENSEPQEGEKQLFARELVRYLEQHALVGDYDRLVLVAPPHFLGLLRKNMSPHAEQRLSTTINKDLTQVPAHDLPSALRPHLAGHLPLRDRTRL